MLHARVMIAPHAWFAAGEPLEVIGTFAALAASAAAWRAARHARRSALASERQAATATRPSVLPSARPGSSDGGSELALKENPTGYTVSCLVANYGPGGALLKEAQAVASNGSPSLSAHFAAPLLALNMATEVSFHFERPTGVHRAFEQPVPPSDENAVRGFDLSITVADVTESSLYETHASFVRVVPPMDRPRVRAQKIGIDVATEPTSRLQVLRNRLFAR